MGQYLQFRSWLRHSSSGEKVLATTAATVVLGLTSWALVPTTDGGASAGGVSAGTSQALTATGPTAVATTGTQAQGQGPTLPTGAGAVGPGQPGGPGAASSGSAAVAPSARGATSGQGGGGATVSTGSGATSGCGPLTSTDVGVTPKQIRVAAVTLNLAGAIGNSAVGVASEKQQRQMAQAMVDDINSHGGIDCRRLVVTFYSGNPIDPSTAQQACLNIAQGNFFAAIDMGGLSYPPGASDCVAQHKVPIFSSQAPTPSEVKQYYPYIMSLSDDPIVDQRNAVFGMKARGWFTAAQGFKKLGILMDECSPEINNATFDALAQIGIPRNQISVASVACPSGGFASPGDMQAAVLQHVRDGVTNVIPIIGGGSFKEYSIAAQRQGFKPRYTTTDYDGFEITATGGTGPDPNNFDGTISVSSTRIGENTSGLSDPATRACIKIFKRHGLPSSWVINPSAAQYDEGGNICSTYETFAATLRNDPGLKRTGVVVGLDKLGHVPLAFLFSDAVFDRPRKVTGGDFWWVVQFHASCTCWKVIDKTMHPSYR